MISMLLFRPLKDIFNRIIWLWTKLLRLKGLIDKYFRIEFLGFVMNVWFLSLSFWSELRRYCLCSVNPLRFRLVFYLHPHLKLWRYLFVKLLLNLYPLSFPEYLSILRDFLTNFRCSIYRSCLWDFIKWIKVWGLGFNSTFWTLL